MKTIVNNEPLYILHFTQENVYTAQNLYKEYREWISKEQFRCCVCRKYPDDLPSGTKIEAAHVGNVAQSETAKHERPRLGINILFIVPLCTECHAKSHLAQNEAQFFANVGLNIHKLAAGYLLKFFLERSD